jgi:hypothetical protein
MNTPTNKHTLHIVQRSIVSTYTRVVFRPNTHGAAPAPARQRSFSPPATDLCLRAAARGEAAAALPPRLRLSSSVDQLSAAAGDEASFAWRMAADDVLPTDGPTPARRAPPPPPRAVLPFPPGSTLRLSSADSRGCATQLALRAAPAGAAPPAVALEARTDDHGRPHAMTVTFESPAYDASSVQGAMLLRWTAVQPDTAPPLCAPLLEADAALGEWGGWDVVDRH